LLAICTTALQKDFFSGIAATCSRVVAHSVAAMPTACTTNMSCMSPARLYTAPAASAQRPQPTAPHSRWLPYSPRRVSPSIDSTLESTSAMNGEATLSATVVSSNTRTKKPDDAVSSLPRPRDTSSATTPTLQRNSCSGRVAVTLQ
jgi:hypothetical protein